MSPALSAMYILTDSRGYTVATHADQSAAFAEAGRLALMAPIEVFHWKRIGGRGHGFKLADRFMWDGGENTWR